MRRCLFVRSSRDLEFTDEWTRAARCYGELLDPVADRVRGEGANAEVDALRAAGWIVAEVVPDCFALQSTWAAERGLCARGADVFLAQLREFAPEVALVDRVDSFPLSTLVQLRSEVKHLVGRAHPPCDGAITPDVFDLLFVDDAELARRLDARGQTVATRRPSNEHARTETAFHSWGARPIDVAFFTQDAVWSSALAESLSRLGRSVDFVTLEQGTQLSGRSVDSSSQLDQAEGSASVFERASRARLALVDLPNSRALTGAVRLVARAGAMVVARYDDELRARFDLGVEASTYRSAEECAALVEFYLDRPDKAHAVAHAGLDRERRDRAAAARLCEELERLVGRDAGHANLSRLTGHARLERTGASP